MLIYFRSLHVCLFVRKTAYVSSSPRHAYSALSTYGNIDCPLQFGNAVLKVASALLTIRTIYNSVFECACSYLSLCLCRCSVEKYWTSWVCIRDNVAFLSQCRCCFVRPALEHIVQKEEEINALTPSVCCFWVELVRIGLIPVVKRVFTTVDITKVVVLVYILLNNYLINRQVGSCNSIIVPLLFSVNMSSVQCLFVIPSAFSVSVIMPLIPQPSQS